MLSLEELKKNDVEELLNINLLEAFIIIILNMDENGGFNRYTIENQRIYRYAIGNISQEIIGEFFRCNIVDMDEENILILVSLTDTNDEVTQIEESVRKIQQTVDTYYEISLAAAISDKIENYSNISKSYKKALHLLSYKLIYGNKCIIKESKLQEILETNKEMFILQKEQKLEGLFISDNEESFRTEIYEIFEMIKNMKYSEIMSSINYLSFLFYKIIKINFPMQFNEQIKQMNILNKNIFNSATLEEIKEIFIEIYINIHKNPQDNISTTNKMLVSTIIQIIEENYKDPNLSQEWIASTLKLSYSNVGKVFKLVESISISDYVNKLRLKYACDLLENTNYSVSDIFNSVGFINQSYFFTLFKKYFGCTPKQYQLQKKFKQF
jgi:YesN/AraC family two-component response regulator